MALLVTLLGAFLWWRQGELVQLLTRRGDVFPSGEKVQFGGLVIYGLLQWLKFAVLAAITILVASFSNTNLYTVVVAFFVQLICQLQYIAVDSWKSAGSFVTQELVWLLSKVFPNFQLFNVGELMVFPTAQPVPEAALAAAIGYGIIYIVVFLALAVFSFRGREI